MATTYYSEEHEWITIEGNTGTVGITDFAQEQLGDIVFAEVTKANEEVTKDEEVAVVERPRRDEAAPEPRPQELVLDRALQRAQAVGGARALSPQLAAVRAVVGAHDVLVQDAIVVRHRLIRGLRRDRGLPLAEELELLQP